VPYPNTLWETKSKEAKLFVSGINILDKLFYNIIGLLHKNEEHRMTIKQAISHEWLQFAKSKCSKCTYNKIKNTIPIEEYDMLRSKQNSFAEFAAKSNKILSSI